MCNDNKKYKLLSAESKHLLKEMIGLKSKKNKIDKVLSKYYECESCKKHFNMSHTTNQIISDGGQFIKYKCPYCEYIQTRTSSYSHK